MLNTHYNFVAGVDNTIEKRSPVLTTPVTAKTTATAGNQATALTITIAHQSFF